MEEGPWIFRGYALMLEEYDGSTSLPTVPPSKVQAWIQIHKVPPLYRIESIMKQLASKVGEVLVVDMKVVSTGTGDFHRAKVNLPADRPLVRVVTLSPEGCQSIVLQVKYEKIAHFCAHCGLMGHTHLECGTGEHEDDALQYGAWMIAPLETWRPGTPRVRDSGPERGMPWSQGGRGDRGGKSFGAGRSGRGSMRGRRGATIWREKAAGASVGSGSRKRMPDEAGLDLQDTTSSPMKPLKEGSLCPEKPPAQKHLSMDSPGSSGGKDVPPPPPQYVSPRDKKRMKRATVRDASM